VSDQMVDNALEDFRKQFATFHEQTAPAKIGNRVEIDFEGYHDSKPIDGGVSKNHPIILGNQVFVPGFEEELIGLSKGEKKEFTVKFPKDYHKKDLQSKNVTFKVEMKDVKDVRLPDFTNEWVQTVSGKRIQSVDDLKVFIRKQLEEEHVSNERKRLENEYIELFVKRVDVELPETLVSDELEYMQRQFQEDLSQKGIEMEQFLTAQKLTQKGLYDSWRQPAEKKIKLRLGLLNISEHEHIETTEDEVTQAMKGANVKNVDDEHTRTAVRSSLIIQRTFQKLFDQAIA